MRTNIGIKITESIRKQRNLLFCGFVLMLFVNILLVWKTITQNQQIVFIPPNIEKPFKLNGWRPSAEYLEMMGIFFAENILNSTPETLNFRLKAVLSFCRNSEAIKKKIISFNDAMKRKRKTISFFPRDTLVDVDGLKVSISGRLITYINGKQSFVQDKTYVVQLASAAGTIKLEDFGERT